MKRLAVAALAALTLAACGSHPDRGTVVGREHHAAYSWVQMVCAGYNKQGICTVQVPVVQHVPESWSLKLRAGEDEWDVDVTEAEYQTKQVGSTYVEVSE